MFKKTKINFAMDELTTNPTNSGYQRCVDALRHASLTPGHHLVRCDELMQVECERLQEISTLMSSKKATTTFEMHFVVVGDSKS